MKTIFSNYKTLAFATLTGAMLTSCALDTVPTPTYAELMIVNAVPPVVQPTQPNPPAPPIPPIPIPCLKINIDGVSHTIDSIPTGSIRGYFPLQGTRSLDLTAFYVHPTKGALLKRNLPFSELGNTFSSAFVYTDIEKDSLVIKYLLVKDDLTFPANDKVHVRVVNLLNTNIDIFATTRGTEGTSIVTSNPISVFSNVAPKSVSAFTPLDAVPLRAGSALPTFVRKNYSFQVRAAGATTNLATLVTSTNNTNANTATLENQRIYTIVVRPGATATAAPTVFGLFNNRR